MIPFTRKDFKLHLSLKNILGGSGEPQCKAVVHCPSCVVELLRGGILKYRFPGPFPSFQFNWWAWGPDTDFFLSVLDESNVQHGLRNSVPQKMGF